MTTSILFFAPTPRSAYAMHARSEHPGPSENVTYTTTTTFPYVYHQQISCSSRGWGHTVNGASIGRYCRSIADTFGGRIRGGAMAKNATVGSDRTHISGDTAGPFRFQQQI